MLDSPAFHWIGLGVVIMVVAVIVVAIIILAIIVISAFAPHLHWRKPTTEMILSSYRKDVVGAEGARIKVADDLEIARLLGFSWGVRFMFGLLVFRRGPPPC